MAFCCLLLYKAFKRGGLASVNTASTESAENKERSPIIFIMTNLMGWSICGRGWKSGFGRPGTQDRSCSENMTAIKSCPMLAVYLLSVPPTVFRVC